MEILNLQMFSMMRLELGNLSFFILISDNHMRFPLIDGPWWCLSRLKLFNATVCRHESTKSTSPRPGACDLQGFATGWLSGYHFMIAMVCYGVPLKSFWFKSRLIQPPRNPMETGFIMSLVLSFAAWTPVGVHWRSQRTSGKTPLSSGHLALTHGYFWRIPTWTYLWKIQDKDGWRWRKWYL